MTTTKTAYIVMGSTGEYEDRTQWIVSVFTGRKGSERAKKLVEKLTQWCKENGLDSTAKRYWDRTHKPTDDPQFKCDYTGTWYKVVEAPHN